MADVHIISVSAYAWPAELHLVCDNFNFIDPTSTPDVSRISIECSTLTFSQYSHTEFYSTSYIGSTSFDTSRIMESSGIHVEPRWIFTVNKKGAIAVNKPGDSKNDRPAHTKSKSEEEFKDATWGWYLKIWIPVPMRLFERMETRVFNIDAKVSIGDFAQPLSVTAEMSLSHLRKEKEMV